MDLINRPIKPPQIEQVLWGSNDLANNQWLRWDLGIEVYNHPEQIC